jgi:hypothetical protein
VCMEAVVATAVSSVAGLALLFGACGSESAAVEALATRPPGTRRRRAVTLVVGKR